VWIAVAGLAAVVVGVVAWWLRRDPVAGDAHGTFETERKWAWELSLTPETEAAFMEGLRAYHDAGNALDLAGEQGVLTAHDPPRLISLHLLAGGFAASGDAALHDPQGTVAAMMAEFAAAEQPGVLHLRGQWPDGGADGMDRAAFAAAVRDIVCPPEAEGIGPCSIDAGAGAGALKVVVTGAPARKAPPRADGEPVATDPVEEASSGTAEEAASGTAEDAASGTCQGVAANTMLLDLGRVLDLYQEAREKQPDAAAGELLREVMPGVIAAGGPGLTWVRPPTPEERRIVTAATGAAELR
jgi:hypothetical protein